MRWAPSMVVDDRFFIMRDYGIEVQVDIIDGELIPEKRLTTEEQQYFKLYSDESGK